MKDHQIARTPLILRAFRLKGRLLLPLLIKVKLKGKNHIPRDRPYIMISNHLSWIDPFIYLSWLPRNHHLLFVSEVHGLTNKAWKRKMMNLVGNPVIAYDRFNERQRISTLKGIMRALNAQQVVGIFPEGRTGRGENDMYPWYTGAFVIAKKMNVPILPIAISGSHRLQWRKPIVAQIGPVQYCAENESSDEFALRMHRMIKEMMPDYPGEGILPGDWPAFTELCLDGRLPAEDSREPIYTSERR